MPAARPTFGCAAGTRRLTATRCATCPRPCPTSSRLPRSSPTRPAAVAGRGRGLGQRRGRSSGLCPPAGDRDRGLLDRAERRGLRRRRGRLARPCTAEIRKEQLEHMAALVEELYPTYRWFLFDGRERGSVPLTVFGPRRAALYVGDIYLHVHLDRAYPGAGAAFRRADPRGAHPGARECRLRPPADRQGRMIAALPMYDWPELRAATDAWWSGLAGHLRAAGLEGVPDHLCREIEPALVWEHPDLLLAQTCGLPFVRRYRDRLRIVATPCYAAEGCDGPTYRSAILVRDDSAIDRPEAAAGGDRRLQCHRLAVRPPALCGFFFGRGGVRWRGRDRQPRRVDGGAAGWPGGRLRHRLRQLRPRPATPAATDGRPADASAGRRRCRRCPT